MAETWFVSDIHFGHRRVLEFEPHFRPFATLEDMNVTIIHNWNQFIGPLDLVYVLGDFAFNREGLRLAKVLHGRKKLVLGNHDLFKSADYLEYFDELMGVRFLSRELAISHVPMHPQELRRASVNVHGHLHSKHVMKGIDRDERYFNVCLEQNGLFPFHMDQIMARVRKVKEDEQHKEAEDKRQSQPHE